MNLKTLTLFSVLFFTSIVSYSQTTDPVIDTTKTVSSLTINLLYSSNTVFVGRKDDGYKAYLNGGITYLHKTGLFASVNGDYYPELKANRITDYSFQAGYQFDIGTQITGSVYVSSLFSNSNSTKLNAGVGTSLGTYFSYENDIVDISAGFDYSKGKFNDITLSPTLSKSIPFTFGTLDQFEVSIDPTFSCSLGSQNYYHYYLIERKYVNPTVILRINEHYKEMKKFQLLDYEFSIPVTLTYNKLTFTFTPYYVIPVNQPDFKNILPLLPGYKSSTNSFYIQSGISYQF